MPFLRGSYHKYTAFTFSKSALFPFLKNMDAKQAFAPLQLLFFSFAEGKHNYMWLFARGPVILKLFSQITRVKRKVIMQEELPLSQSNLWLMKDWAKVA